MGFLARILINALAIFFASAVVPGIEISGPLAALGAGLVFGLINGVIRPILIILTLPLTLLTLGRFLLVFLLLLLPLSNESLNLVHHLQVFVILHRTRPGAMRAIVHRGPDSRLPTRKSDNAPA